MAIESREEVVEWIKALTVLELSELVGELEEALGVSAAVSAAGAAAAEWRVRQAEPKRQGPAACKRRGVAAAV